jgi:hypothetical protein
MREEPLSVQESWSLHKGVFSNQTVMTTHTLSLREYQKIAQIGEYVK